ncbi:MAG TPA: hypothetical protein VGY99_14870 [Candidatus Binataceae bacterium]|nr:hypothetical protein [Candidatus Binataceae bacterium]
MGKTADNERIKLRATYYNNIAVGLVLAGCLIPYLALVRGIGEIFDWMRHHTVAEITFVGWASIITTVLAFFLALHGAKRFRRAANDQIGKLQD